MQLHQGLPPWYAAVLGGAATHCTNLTLAAISHHAHAASPATAAPTAALVPCA